MSDNEARPAPQADPAAPEVVDGIRSLHERIDELHRLVAQRLEAEGVHAGEWLHERAGVVHQHAALPAWRRRTQGELRWPVAATVAIGIGLQIAVPGRLVLVHPAWVLPVVQGALLVILIAPTDVLPMSRWAKAAMTMQSIISIVTVALVVSRAVNILPSGLV